MVFLTPGIGGSRTYTLEMRQRSRSGTTAHAGTLTPVVSAVVTPRRNLRSDEEVNRTEPGPASPSLRAGHWKKSRSCDPYSDGRSGP